jgi:hypothetical protein
MRYVYPKFKERGFNCPHSNCGAYALQRWNDLYTPGSSVISDLDIAYCDHCGKYSLWQNHNLIYPAVRNAPPAHSDMPEGIKIDYEEARSVFGESPRSSAALLRLTIQKLCKHLGLPGTNINDDIKAMVANGLPVQVQQALDIVRVIGNEQVHPGTLDVRDDPEMATRLFELVNLIVEDRIARPKQIATLYAKLPEEKRKGIEQRDAKPKASAP